MGTDPRRGLCAGLLVLVVLCLGLERSSRARERGERWLEQRIGPVVGSPEHRAQRLQQATRQLEGATRTLAAVIGEGRVRRDALLHQSQLLTPKAERQLFDVLRRVHHLEKHYRAELDELGRTELAKKLAVHAVRPLIKEALLTTQAANRLDRDVTQSPSRKEKAHELFGTALSSIEQIEKLAGQHLSSHQRHTLTLVGAHLLRPLVNEATIEAWHGRGSEQELRQLSANLASRVSAIEAATPDHRLLPALKDQLGQTEEIIEGLHMRGVRRKVDQTIRDNEARRAAEREARPLWRKLGERLLEGLLAP